MTIPFPFTSDHRRLVPARVFVLIALKMDQRSQTSAFMYIA